MVGGGSHDGWVEWAGLCGCIVGYGGGMSGPVEVCWCSPEVLIGLGASTVDRLADVLLRRLLWMMWIRKLLNLEGRAACSGSSDGTDGVVLVSITRRSRVMQ